MLKHSNVMFSEKSVDTQSCVVSHCHATKATVHMTTGQDDDIECLMHTPEYTDVKLLVDYLPLWNKFVMNNTPGVKKDYYNGFCFRWPPPRFL